MEKVRRTGTCIALAELLEVTTVFRLLAFDCLSHEQQHTGLAYIQHQAFEACLVEHVHQETSHITGWFCRVKSQRLQINTQFISAGLEEMQKRKTKRKITIITQNIERGSFYL